MPAGTCQQQLPEDAQTPLRDSSLTLSCFVSSSSQRTDSSSTPCGMKGATAALSVAGATATASGCVNLCWGITPTPTATREEGLSAESSCHVTGGQHACQGVYRDAHNQQSNGTTTDICSHCREETTASEYLHATCILALPCYKLSCITSS